MKQSKTLLLTGLAAATVVGGTLFTSAVSAQTTRDGTGLADAIAAKFNLKSEDVQTVIKDYRVQYKAEHEQQMQVKLNERLDQAVTDGKITAEQKELITTKLAEVKSKMQELRDMTDKEARKTAMDQLHSDLKSWAEANNIPTDLMGPMGGVGKRGMMIKHHLDDGGDMPLNAPSEPSTTN